MRSFYIIMVNFVRNNGTATTFLTTVAFLYVITSSLPKTNYTTAINYAVTYSFVIQLVIWLFSNVNFLLLRGGEEDLALEIDNYCAIFIPIVYYIGTLLLIFRQLLMYHFKSADSVPMAQLKTSSNGDPALPIYTAPGTMKFFPFVEGKNVFF